MARRERQRDTFSPTGAVSIGNETFQVFESSDRKTGKYKFKVTIIDLKKKYSFPPPSKLKISIRKGTGNLVIVDLGEIAYITDDGEFDFEVDLPPGKGNITCRLNVVQASGPEYLGFSNWRHTKDAKSTSLFRLRPSNELGNRLWEFEIDGDEYTTPVLYINKEVKGLMEALYNRDVLIEGLIYPTVIRLGFREIIFKTKDVAFHGIDLDKTWQKIWWEFAQDSHEKANEIADKNPSDDEKEEFLDQLVDASVTIFDFVDRVGTYLENINKEDD